MAKQRYNWDCGHTCLADHGFPRPAARRGLTPSDILALIPGSTFEVLLDDTLPNKNGLLLIDGDLCTHWVSCKPDRAIPILDPHDGLFYSPEGLVEKYHESQVAGFLGLP